MDNDFKVVLSWLTDEFVNNGKQGASGEEDMPIMLTIAFLTALTEGDSLNQKKSTGFLSKKKGSVQWGGVADFYLKGIEEIKKEIDRAFRDDEYFNNRLKSLARWVRDRKHNISGHEMVERVWSVFFPEGCNIFSKEAEAVESLRKKRRVKIIELNDNPIKQPAEEIIFTSNILLTVPPEGAAIENLPVGKTVKDRLADIINEDQIYWYDHPIQVGVKNENNEFLYGLQGLEDAVRFEKDRGNLTGSGKTVCLLSVSATHNGLHEITRPYIEDVLAGSDDLGSLDVYVFTEADTQDMIKEVIIPAAESFLNRDASGLTEIFGVDGEYGRHYSFLKAVALFWNVLIDDRIRATFKIDLDQVFPQDDLVRETGKSAFEHFITDLWGACGTDFSGRPVELGMIAGALVNDCDISSGLCTPDVSFPSKKPDYDETVFFSQLPQALSTEAEMMTRYGENSVIDGKNECIERIHVTGGTNGILVESLRKHRPFTPSFIGRAEDQAYILSTLFNMRERLGYVHEDGMIMRHDKDSFAGEAIRSAHVSKLVGDYIRILYFSAYGKIISDDLTRLKELMDPFTGCFISRIPITVVYLRFALKVIALYEEGKRDDAYEFIQSGSKRIFSAILFSTGRGSELKKQYEKERKAWKLFYDTMSAIEDSIHADNRLGQELRRKAVSIVNRCMLKKRQGRHR